MPVIKVSIFAHDGMWIADRHDPNIDTLTTGIDLIGRLVAGGVKRQRFGVKVGLTKFDRYLTIVFQTCPRQPAGVFEQQFLARFTADKSSYTTGTIAALLGLAAVRVVDPVEHIASLCPRRLKTQQLIEADAGMPVAEIANGFTRQHRLSLRTDDDKVIAKAMHFGK